MSRVYTEVTPAAGAYPTDPQVVLTFEPDGWKLYPRAAGGNDAFYSFDGTNDHGKVLGVTLATAGNIPVTEVGPTKKLWLRQGAGAPVVGVQAFTNQ